MSQTIDPGFAMFAIGEKQKEALINPQFEKQLAKECAQLRARIDEVIAHSQELSA